MPQTANMSEHGKVACKMLRHINDARGCPVRATRAAATAANCRNWVCSRMCPQCVFVLVVKAWYEPVAAATFHTYKSTYAYPWLPFELHAYMIIPVRACDATKASSYYHVKCVDVTIRAMTSLASPTSLQRKEQRPQTIRKNLGGNITQQSWWTNSHSWEGSGWW